MELGEPDASGRAPAGAHRRLASSSSPCDVVVVAIGTRANPLLTATCPDLKLNKWGNIVVDDNGMTSLPGVFAGGDIVRGAATVILAMGDGKRAAAAIDEYVTGALPATRQTPRMPRAPPRQLRRPSAAGSDAASRSRMSRLTPSTGTRSCAIESRSRTVTAPSSSESTSTVTHHGVPISSWRR